MSNEERERCIYRYAVYRNQINTWRVRKKKKEKKKLHCRVRAIRYRREQINDDDDDDDGDDVDDHDGAQFAKGISSGIVRFLYRLSAAGPSKSRVPVVGTAQVLNAS